MAARLVAFQRRTGRHGMQVSAVRSHHQIVLAMGKVSIRRMTRDMIIGLPGRRRSKCIIP